MLNKLLISLLFCSSLFASQDFRVTVSSRFEQEAFVNGIRVYCDCGKSPVLIMFLCGQVQLYCEEHMPEIERTRRITPDNLSEALRRES